MAGVSVGESDENPVAINVTAMVDIIFCLCVFYMCSFKFKQLEGKFDSWLPKDKGTGGVGDTTALIQEIRVALFWDDAGQKTIRRFLSREVTSDVELQQFIHDQHADNLRLGKTDVPVIVDAEARVPWTEVITVINLAKREGIANIEFALGLPLQAK
ncbi:MAG TPA: biopolymer transporter ExbD [Planctomycetota bacterium]|nr:biopolymer transporter ExbD [Planctomycetota bacterium]